MGVNRIMPIRETNISSGMAAVFWLKWAQPIKKGINMQRQAAIRSE